MPLPLLGGAVVATLGLLAGAWWPWRTQAMLDRLWPACAAPARAELHSQGLGLQVLLALSALWLLGSVWWVLRQAPQGQAATPSIAPPAAPRADLETLRHIGGLLTDQAINGPRLLRMLGPLQQALGARTVAVWLDAVPRQVLGCPPLLCSQGVPALTLDELSDPVATPGGARWLTPGPGVKAAVLTVPLRAGAQQLGTLVVEFAPDHRMDDGLRQLADTAATMTSLALAAVCSSQEERRLALMEERGAIAAELHDSLAQALAYMKIQVAQLQRGLDAATLPPELVATAQDLRTGLSNAYRDVRELIAAFRVRMGAGGLCVAVQDTLDELAQRGGLDIAFEHALEPCPLGVNEEFHVMQVIREALSNTVRHAAATQAWVSIRPQGHRLEVTIDDDGRGLGEPDPQGHHYGLGIMQERARSLGGTLTVSARPGGGTRVQLLFAPQSLLATASVQEAA